MKQLTYIFLACLLTTLALPIAGQTFRRKPTSTEAAAEAAPTAQKKTPRKAKPKAPVKALPEEETNIPEDRITTAALKRKLDAKADIIIIDTRAGGAWQGSAVKLPGALHVPTDQLEEAMKTLPKQKEIIAYCT